MPQTSQPPRSAAGHWPLALFRQAAEQVPAYAEFLAAAGCVPAEINDPADFARVPLTTKRGYLQTYPLNDLLWNGDFGSARIISTSSGSSGPPAYWPHGDRSHRDAVRLNARVLGDLGCLARPTLCVIAFSMGTYVAAVYQLDAVVGLSRAGHPLTAVSPGMDVEQNVRILRDLAPRFHRTVLMGYPPLVRDILVAARDAGIEPGTPRGPRLRLVLAGERISEHWRDTAHRLAGITDPAGGSLNIYGTADAGIIGAESPLTVHVRRAASRSRQLRDALFPRAGVLPSFVEYDPGLRHVEVVDGHLVITARNSLPLLRYRLGDTGRVLRLPALATAMERAGHALPDRLTARSTGHFIALYGRTDIACSFYALNIYPDNVQAGLEGLVAEDLLTGRFVLSAPESPDAGQHLLLRVELAPGITAAPALATRTAEAVRRGLLRTNGEFRRLSELRPERCGVTVELRPAGHADFAARVKQRWIAP